MDYHKLMTDQFSPISPQPEAGEPQSSPIARRSLLSQLKSLDWSFIRGSSLNSLGIAVGRVLGFAFSFVVANAFSSQDYGNVVYVITLAGVLAIVTQPFGQRTMAYFIGKYADERERLAVVMQNMWVVALVLFGLTLLISTPILLASGRFSWELMIVYVGITLFYTYYGIASGFLASWHLLFAYVGSNLVQIVVVALIVYVFQIRDAALVTSIYGLSYLPTLLLLLIFAPLPLSFRLRVNRAEIRDILTMFAPILISHALYTGYISVDVLMLEHFKDEATVGVFGLTRTLSIIFHFIPGGITLMLMPKVAGMRKGGHRKILLTALLLSVGINVVGGTIYLLLYPWFVTTFFGEEYFIGMDFAFIMALSAILFGIYSVITAVYVGVGRASRETVGRAVMLAVVLVAGLALIPTQGAQGAALASLAASASGFFVYALYLVIPRLRKATAEI